MYDVAVLGSGPGGYVAALRAALRGAKVCCIEQGDLGGTCLNVGCIPTKTMLHASELFWNIRKAESFGFKVGDPQVDETAYLKRVGMVTAGLRKGVEYLLKNRKVDVIRGRGCLRAKDTIMVETQNGSEEVKAKAIILAPGSRPVRPGFLPWDCDRLITTNEATTAETLPKSILILGGGVIGCEFATVYGELGIETTIVEMLDTLVANLDKDVSKAITRSLEKRKVKVLVGSKVTGMKAGENSVTAELEDGKTIEAETVLVAIGRQPNTENIGLEDVGVKVENRLIVVDDRCQTNIEGVYAIGDAAEVRQYAHLASRMGVIAADNATGHPASDNRDVVPTGVYTHPEVATVGLSEQQAREKEQNVKVASFPYKASGMAQAYSETEGLVKIIAEEEMGSILGAVVIGPHATDVIQEVTVAMKNELTVEELAETIHAHPTFVEAVGEAAEIWLGMPIHSGV